MAERVGGLAPPEERVAGRAGWRLGPTRGANSGQDQVELGADRRIGAPQGPGRYAWRHAYGGQHGRTHPIIKHRNGCGSEVALATLLVAAKGKCELDWSGRLARPVPVIIRRSSSITSSRGSSSGSSS